MLRRQLFFHTVKRVRFVEPLDIYPRETHGPMIKLPEAMTPKRSHDRVKIVGRQYNPDFHSQREAIERANELFQELCAPKDSSPEIVTTHVEVVNYEP